ncbi:Hypothetical protein LUCI_4582 [Lucifera butyrica]|uniref:Uncharacterized protein n=1 Tax=Lucifera butyrica TaxID=1351585 RepID=A0A498RGT5_9FIRM|nr:Hypothetical protein LUCI_4582 [Lucifera butyrica]
MGEFVNAGLLHFVRNDKLRNGVIIKKSPLKKGIRKQS